jgi:hypothetical protein
MPHQPQTFVSNNCFKQMYATLAGNQACAGAGRPPACRSSPSMVPPTPEAKVWSMKENEKVRPSWPHLLMIF